MRSEPVRSGGRFVKYVEWIGGGATAVTGLCVLLIGLLPPHVMETGQLDPRVWLWPMLCGAVLLVAVFRYILGRWCGMVMVSAMLALLVPPLILCLAGSTGQTGRLTTWLHPVAEVPQVARRSRIGIISGPMLHEPARGGAIAGFAVSPLWEILGRRFDHVPFAALDATRLDQMAGLLVIQPRALAPEELVALDGWVRRGGRAVLLVDPDLRWADERPLGHALRAPSVSLLDPLLNHWGLILAPAPHRAGGDPVERRFLDGPLDGGRMIQIAGASHFIPKVGAPCALSSGGLVARCTLGRGHAILVADADFANDALWAVDPREPGRTARWTSDTVPALLDWLMPGTGNEAGKRVWLARADALPGALRPALAVLALFVTITIALLYRLRTKRELRPLSHL